MYVVHLRVDGRPAGARDDDPVGNVLQIQPHASHLEAHGYEPRGGWVAHVRGVLAVGAVGLGEPGVSQVVGPDPTVSVLVVVHVRACAREGIDRVEQCARDGVVEVQLHVEALVDRRQRGHRGRVVPGQRGGDGASHDCSGRAQGVGVDGGGDAPCRRRDGGGGAIQAPTPGAFGIRDSLAQGVVREGAPIERRGPPGGVAGDALGAVRGAGVHHVGLAGLGGRAAVCAVGDRHLCEQGGPGAEVLKAGEAPVGVVGAGGAGAVRAGDGDDLALEVAVEDDCGGGWVRPVGHGL